MANAMYEQSTRSIHISVEPFYRDDESSPSSHRFVFGYRVQIDNQGTEAVQLMSRHWQITDGLGRTMEVQGAGVVGEQPLIEPGECFEYSSGTPLITPTGIMVGRYQMVTESGERFDAEIPLFRSMRPASISSRTDAMPAPKRSDHGNPALRRRVPGASAGHDLAVCTSRLKKTRPLGSKH